MAVATTIELINGGEPITFNCADGTGIPKGTLLKLTSGRIVAAASADGDIWAGVAAAEKVANDGATTIAVYTKGIFEMTTSAAAISTGDQLSINGANEIKIFTAGDYEDGVAFGKALTDVGGAGGTVDVAIGVY